MTGDFDYADIDYKPDYAAAGFGSMVNFYFPKHGDLDAIVATWQRYADSICSHNDWHPFSDLNNSYNRETDMDNIIDCATTLLLAPGAVQIFYGDETRRGLSDARLNVDSDQAFRSDMNWDNIDTAVLEHFRILGTIRKQHPAIAVGRQKTIDCHTCTRTADETILIRLKPIDGLPILVDGIYPDGTTLNELYSGQTAVVKDGKVNIGKYKNNIAVFAVNK